MKKISILAIVVLVFFICISLVDAGKGAVDGWSEAGDSRDHTRTLVSLQVTKSDVTPMTDSLYNSVLGEHVPYHVETIETFIHESFWLVALKFFIFPIALFALYGFYCLIRLLISVVRKEVFVRKNVLRMRIFVYGVISVAIFMELERYGQYLNAMSQIQLAGYEICAYSQKYPGFHIFLLALFTEIFAVGVKIKEEQDLTI